MRKARLENNVVVEILEATPFPPFHPSLVWVKCPKIVKEGWIWDGKTFTNPEDIKTYKQKRIEEYPQINELADALYWNSKGDSSHLEEYFNKCEAVKNKYPKEELND